MRLDRGRTLNRPQKRLSTKKTVNALESIVNSTNRLHTSRQFPVPSFGSFGEGGITRLIGNGEKHSTWTARDARPRPERPNSEEIQPFFASAPARPHPNTFEFETSRPRQNELALTAINGRPPP